MRIFNFVAHFALAAGLVASGGALAAYPEKPVTLVVPYPAGGATDVIARLVADKLPAKWGQQVIVTNRPGAGTTLAAEGVARAPADGYTLYMTTAAHTISASLYKNLNYDPLKDFAPITLTARIPLVLVTAKSVPAKTLSELIEYGKQAEQGLTMASSGNGSPQHLTGELFKSETGLKLVHIPYRGDTPMLTDLVGGQVQMAFVTLSAALPHIQAGKLNAIALASEKRIAAIGDVPTMAEAGMPGFVAATWFGLFAPAGIPDDIREKIYQDVSAIVGQPEMTRKLQDMGAEVNNSTPQEFQAFIDAEAKRWAEGVRISGARID